MVWRDGSRFTVSDLLWQQPRPLQELTDVPWLSISHPAIASSFQISARNLSRHSGRFAIRNPPERALLPPFSAHSFRRAQVMVNACESPLIAHTLGQLRSHKGRSQSFEDLVCPSDMFGFTSKCLRTQAGPGCEVLSRDTVRGDRFIAYIQKRVMSILT